MEKTKYAENKPIEKYGSELKSSVNSIQTKLNNILSSKKWTASEANEIKDTAIKQIEALLKGTKRGMIGKHDKRWLMCANCFADDVIYWSSPKNIIKAAFEKKDAIMIAKHLCDNPRLRNSASLTKEAQSFAKEKGIDIYHDNFRLEKETYSIFNNFFHSKKLRASIN